MHSTPSVILIFFAIRCSFSFLLSRKPRSWPIAVHDEEQRQRADLKQVRIARSVLPVPLLFFRLVRNDLHHVAGNVHCPFAAET